MNPVTLHGPLQLSAEASWLLVACLLPAGSVAFAAWSLVRAFGFERRRRACLAPPLGFRSVTGKVVTKPERKPAVRVDFELVTKTVKGKMTFTPRSHAVIAKPFRVETEEGERFDVRAHRDDVALHAAVDGNGAVRFCQIGAGDTAWVYGPTALVRPSDVNGPSTDSHANSTEHTRGPSLWISTTPIEVVFGAERNHWLALAAAVLALVAIVELAAFGTYWDVVREGEPAVGRVIEKSVALGTSRERYSRPRSTETPMVSIEVDGRRADFEVTKRAWEQVTEQTPVAMLVSPKNVMLGPQPHVSALKAAMMALLVFFGLLGAVAVSFVQRPWYSVKRGWRGMDRSLVVRTGETERCLPYT